MCNHLMMQDTARFVSVSKATVLPVFSYHPSIHLFSRRMLQPSKNHPPSFRRNVVTQVVLFYSEQELLVASCRHTALFSYF